MPRSCFVYAVRPPEAAQDQIEAHKAYQHKNFEAGA